MEGHISNSYYNASGTPATGSAGSSAPIRAEYTLIATGFNLLPQLTGGTAATLTFPNATDTLVARNTAETLTNKSISGSSNTLTSIANASLVNSQITIGAQVVSLGDTLTTIDGLTLTSPTINGTITGSPGLSGNWNLGTPSAVTLTNGVGLPITTGVTGLGAGIATALASTPTGTGAVVLANSPTLVSPTLGTPAGGTLTNCTNLPVSTGLSGAGTGVATALGLSVTGSGGIVLATSANMTTPNLGTPSAATLTNATGLPLTSGVTGTLGVSNGGTGAVSFTADGVLYGNGASAIGVTSSGASGQALISNGAGVAPSFQNLIPTGTVMLFMQSAAPTGWTQVNTWNDAVIRIVNNTGTGGAAGGTWTISGNFGTTSGHALSTAELAAHNHVINIVDPGHAHEIIVAQDSIQGGGSTGYLHTGTLGDIDTEINVTGITATSNNAGSGTAHTHTLSAVSSDAVWRPSFVNSLVCSKN